MTWMMLAAASGAALEILDAGRFFKLLWRLFLLPLPTHHEDAAANELIIVIMRLQACTCGLP